MSWQPLQSSENWQDLRQLSQDAPQVIFKHSTRCSISSMALQRFENSTLFNSNEWSCWYLDLLQFRSLSDQIAHDLNVVHQSPQVIVLYQNQVRYQASHGLIDAQEMLTSCSSL
ncbi:MAG: hypothetical protein RLZZ301_778 [Bacteroidota bacterium]|jgi:bacillithiol system protein YtxJ